MFTGINNCDAFDFDEECAVYSYLIYNIYIASKANYLLVEITVEGIPLN